MRELNQNAFSFGENQKLELRVLGKFSYAPIGKFFSMVFWQGEFLGNLDDGSWGCRLWHSPIKKRYFSKDSIK
jgi:hypothetical protein